MFSAISCFYIVTHRVGKHICMHVIPMDITLFDARDNSDTCSLCVNVIQLDDIILTGITKHTPDV